MGNLEDVKLSSQVSMKTQNKNSHSQRKENILPFFQMLLVGLLAKNWGKIG